MLRTINDQTKGIVNLRTVEVNFGPRTVEPRKGREQLDKLNYGHDAKKRRGALRIIATGLLIFNAALSIKYGMYPCMRFSPAKDSDASSAATKCWKTVDASLG